MLGFQKGATNRSVPLALLNTDGTPATGVAYNAAGAAATYQRQGAAAVAIPLAALASAIAAHADGGWFNTTGRVYRLDLPDAALASGADYVVISVEFTGVQPVSLLVDLTGDDYRTAGETSGAIATAVAADLADDFAAIPTANENTTAVVAGLAADFAALPTDAEIADKVLVRNLAGGSDGGRTVQSALRRLRNKSAIVGSTLTVYEEDDATADHTATVTGTSAVTAVDPA